MIKRHQDQIDGQLELIETVGIATFSRSWLRIVYGQERFSKSIYQDLMDRLPSDYKAEDLYIFEWQDTIHLIEAECVNRATDMI